MTVYQVRHTFAETFISTSALNSFFYRSYCNKVLVDTLFRMTSAITFQLTSFGTNSKTVPSVSGSIMADPDPF
jgi:hypothetical protein